MRCVRTQPIVKLCAYVVSVHVHVHVHVHADILVCPLYSHRNAQQLMVDYGYAVE